MHNNHTYKITFTHKERKYILHPLTPSLVLADQIKLKDKINNEKNLALLGKNLRHIEFRCDKI